ncbi:hypothetical protein [Acinetobacter radioresistens]|uniref:hypothetical protein n=1 Tax=Acinetobacter radioresistens TaxID=40216 RepID=UPI0020048487|nr:hypothetical protein [Acinetobacter radioresistens]MCK4108912.1 hypothetical protein [Acinetobacter radioresistens]
MDKLKLLEPLEFSHTANELERALQAAFIKTYIELLGDDIKDLFDYSAPHMAGPRVVERFTKQNGLVVLRRPNTSETLMRVIYATWMGLASKRGLAFLDFVLRMLWPAQYEIKRLYHSKSLAKSYPDRLTYFKTEDTFLTSRIHVTMSDDVDLKELAELAPTLTKLVPANVVPSIAISVNLEPISVNTAIGCKPIMIGNFEPDY